MERYKCHTCKLILDEDQLIDEKCPTCLSNEGLQKMCPNDHCHCPHDIVETVAFCELCGSQCCPICGCEDVVQISRVTGYYQEVGGWNRSKQQELRDRTRYNALNGQVINTKISKI